ncbi:dihydroorotate dehydrogenase electron transfer subunit [Intrasporangium sp. DVR]|uniref:iron-sulfur cluster-binding protein n=1 Tax=Intrasporangium sp. DVR TaxID=3127867 RepID=UPI00333EC76B
MTPDSEATQVIRRSRVTQERSEVIAARRVGSFQHLTLVAPRVAETAGPGQLVALAVGDAGAALPLRRLLPIHQVSPSGTYGGTVEVVVQLPLRAAQGADRGSEWLARRRPHDHVDVVGPLGRRFPLPAAPQHCILVAEGPSGGTLLWLAALLRARGCRVDMVLGGASEDQLLGVIEARRRCDETIVTTCDGSAGVRGRPTDVLPGLLDRSAAAVVYAAGPVDLLRATAAAATRAGAVSMIGLPSRPGCGIGICLDCVMPVVGNDGLTRAVRVCTEGPVLRGDRVRWDQLVDGRWQLPPDVVVPGAP